MTIRTSAITLLGTTGLSGVVRASHNAIRILADVRDPIRTSHNGVRILADVRDPVRASQVFVMMLAGMDSSIFPNLLESDSEIYGVDHYNVTLTARGIPEFNPYRSTIPESLLDISSELYDYTRENQETLRAQHNLLQAGDSTFPWEMFAIPHDKRAYTLGSVGRFFHENYGLIHARYVKFDSIKEGVNAACPMGLLKSATGLDWVCTNQLDHSDPFLLIGLNAAFVLPTNGQFGWVIVDGVNLQEIRNESEDYADAESFGWSSNGLVSNKARGLVLGRRVVKATSVTLGRGTCYIRVESFTYEAIADYVRQITSELESEIADLQRQVDLLVQATQVFSTLQAIQKTLASIQTKLTNEEKQRKAADSALNARISNLDVLFATKTELGLLASSIQNSITNVSTTLGARIEAVKAIAQAALEAAQNPVDTTLFDEQIQALASAISAEVLRVKGRFPVVDGSIPPNLVYMDDGSLVYTETY